MLIIVEELLRRVQPLSEIEKVLGGSFHRVLEDIWGPRKNHQCPTTTKPPSRVCHSEWMVGHTEAILRESTSVSPVIRSQFCDTWFRGNYVCENNKDLQHMIGK